MKIENSIIIYSSDVFQNLYDFFFCGTQKWKFTAKCTMKVNCDHIRQRKIFTA